MWHAEYRDRGTKWAVGSKGQEPVARTTIANNLPVSAWARNGLSGDGAHSQALEVC